MLLLMTPHQLCREGGLEAPVVHFLMSSRWHLNTCQCALSGAGREMPPLQNTRGIPVGQPRSEPQPRVLKDVSHAWLSLAVPPGCPCPSSSFSWLCLSLRALPSPPEAVPRASRDGIKELQSVSPGTASFSYKHSKIPDPVPSPIPFGLKMVSGLLWTHLWTLK